MKFLLPLMLTVACGDNISPYTWGEASLSVAEAWCEAARRCSALSDTDVERCTTHFVFHLCGLDDTCDVVIENASDIETCAQAIADVGCFSVVVGIAPPECDALSEIQP